MAPSYLRPRSSAHILRNPCGRHKALLIRIIPLLFLSCLLILLLLHIFSHNISLDIPSLCAINQKLDHRHSLLRSISNSTTKFSILTFVDGPALSSLARPYSSFLESRSLYASLHGYILRTYFHRPDVRRPIVWSKLLAIHEIFFPDLRISPSTGEIKSPLSDAIEEWVWVLDLDALIFNFNVKLESIIESAGNRGNIDIIIACDHNGLNAGSFLVRKSEWTREFLKRWWRRGNDKGVPVPMMDKLFEQAALTDLVRRDKSVAAHVHIAPIRDFNAYGYPAGELYLFQTGDFVVHCPGPTLKKWLPAYARQWEEMMKECNLRDRWMDSGNLLEATAGAANG